MGLQLNGLSVEQAIALLQKENPKALLIVPAGDGTVAAVTKVKRATAYRYTEGTTYGGSPFLCTFDQDAPNGGVESVLIE